MKLFQLFCRKKAQVENLSNIENQSHYAVPYQHTNVLNDTQTDIRQHAEQMRREMEKLIKENNRLKAQTHRTEGAYEQMQVENLRYIESQPYYEVPYQHTNDLNGTQTDIRQHTEQMSREMEKLINENNRLKAQTHRTEGAYEQMRNGIEKLTKENNGLKNDIRKQAEQIGGEKGKHIEEINRLKAQANRREGAYEQMRREMEKLTEENNELKNDIRQHAEEMGKAKGHLTEEINGLKNDIRQQAEQMRKEKEKHTEQMRKEKEKHTEEMRKEKGKRTEESKQLAAIKIKFSTVPSPKVAKSDSTIGFNVVDLARNNFL